MLNRKPLMLALVSALASPVAIADNVAVMQELRRLAERVEQLEAANKKLEAALTTAPAAKMSACLEEVEGEVVKLRDAPKPLPSLEGVSAGASLLMVAQKPSGTDDGKPQLTARADVEVELPMGSLGDSEGKLFAQFRAGDGDGIDVGAYATPNATAFGNQASPVLIQAWYQLDIPVGAASGNLGRVEVTVGKIDPFGFFDGNNIADDESEQFLNLAFIHNPLLDAGGDIGVGSHGASPGVRVAYLSDVNGGTPWSASLGVFGAGEGADYLNSFQHPLVIGQVEFAGKTFGALAGAFRLYAWSNGNATPLDEASRDRHTGWGVSLDQDVTPHIALFSRIGFSTDGEVAVDRAFTLGAQFAGAAWGRDKDRIGLAYAWMKASDESGLEAAEQVLELYYAWQVNEHLSLSPDVQWIRHPGGDKSAGNMTVWGLRAKAAF
ncbi:MAG: carbohydrate porin [Pseudomonadota bacterium]